jgi:hypothetical protein
MDQANWSNLTKHTQRVLHSDSSQSPSVIVSGSGTDVMILKIFTAKNSAKKLAFLTENKANFK